MIGITIAPVVTRYRFELAMYTQNNLTTPTEVYYTEYIADAIPLSVTYYSLTSEMNEYTHLRF
jgi:TRAP-type C4-dicarboxylate transport system permease small subunit